MTKRCSKCGETKPLDDFHYTKSKYAKDGRTKYCKPCAIAAATAWNRKNRKRRQRIGRASTIKAKYGLTAETEAHMVDGQGRACAACSMPFNLAGKRPYHIDHCHDTGRVRGLLCANCNVALGHARDDVERLRNLIAYLERT